MNRVPADSIVVDANILLCAVLGRRTRQTLLEVAERRSVVTSERAADEVRAVARSMSARLATASAVAREVLEEIDVWPASEYRGEMDMAEITLRRAVASRDANVRDAHILALAWRLEADIWSHDRDFAGTGWPSWSSANLLAQLIAFDLADRQG